MKSQYCKSPSITFQSIFVCKLCDFPTLIRTWPAFLWTNMIKSNKFQPPCAHVKVAWLQHTVCEDAMSVDKHPSHTFGYVSFKKINFLPIDRFSNLPSLEGFPAWKYSIFPYFGLLDPLPRRNSNYEIPRGVSLGISWSHTIRVDLCILCNGLDFYWTSVHCI